MLVQILEVGKSKKKENYPRTSSRKKISKLLNEKIILLGSGRTDTGVHAIEQSAHFDCKNLIKDFDRFLKSINHF